MPTSSSPCPAFSDLRHIVSCRLQSALLVLLLPAPARRNAVVSMASAEPHAVVAWLCERVNVWLCLCRWPSSAAFLCSVLSSRKNTMRSLSRWGAICSGEYKAVCVVFVFELRCHYVGQFRGVGSVCVCVLRWTRCAALNALLLNLVCCVVCCAVALATQELCGTKPEMPLSAKITRWCARGN